MLIKTAAKAILGIVFGVLVVPCLLFFTKSDATKLRCLDSLYGNKVDGLGGDFGDNPAITMPSNAFTRTFPRFYWLAVRNPFNNWLRSQGANGVIKEVWRNKDKVHEVGHYRSWVILDGETSKHHFKYGYIKIGSKYIRYAIGTKLWALNPSVTKSEPPYRDLYKAGDQIEAAYALSVAIRSNIG